MRSIGEIIANNRKKKNMLQSDLANEMAASGLTVSSKAISKWETDKNGPGVPYFLEMCRILGIADVYEEYFGSNPNNPLSELNDEGKAKAIEYIQLLVESGKYKKKTVEIIPFRRKLRLFDIPVSAGTGSILDGDNYEEIEVGAEVPEEADFGLRISGDSMEPQFINGQIVWVKQQNYLEDGEIGIFFLDGSGYIKKLQDNKDGHNLISLNKAYKPIPIVEDSNFMIFGKVIG